MRGTIKTIFTLLILAGSIVGVYYVYQARTASQAGETYSIASVPADLARDIVGLFDPVETHADTMASSPRPPKEAPPEKDAPDGAEGAEAADRPEPEPEQTLYDRANEHYLASRFADAEPLLLRSLNSPGPAGARPAELLARTRLFLLLLEDTRRESALEGLPVGYLMMQKGRRPMLVRVTEETPEEIAFTTGTGIRSSVKTVNLHSRTVGHTRAQKIAIFEREYRLRHETTRTAQEFLDLARFSSKGGLDDHTTYCLERAIAAPGDGVEKVLTDLYAAGSPERQALIGEMFRRFYPRSDVTARLYKPVVTRKPIAKGDEKAMPDNDPDPDGRESGIGGTGQRAPRKSNGEIEALLAKAAAHRKVGDEYYKKAFAGGPKASAHKDKALKAYRDAQEIYEKVEQKWNVGLDRTFKDIQTRVYDLLKSIR